MEPPWRSTIAFVIDNPSPAPDGTVHRRLRKNEDEDLFGVGGRHPREIVLHCSGTSRPQSRRRRGRCRRRGSTFMALEMRISGAPG